VPSPHRFDRDTAVSRIDASGFEARIDRGWWIHRGPNGGYVAAIVVRALAEAVADSERSPRSVTIHFTAPPEEGPVRLETRIERVGRSLTTATARMWQGQRLCAVALGAFSKERPGPSFQDVVMPEVPPPARAPRLQGTSPAPIAIRERYEQRSVASLLVPAPGERAVTGGWVRLAEPRLADAPLVAAFCDSWPPAVMQRAQHLHAPGRGVPTVDLTVHFRARLPLPDASPEDFYLALFHTTTARQGFLEEDGEIWSAKGVLVAQSRQLAVFA
jgi:acyl-CoA thioesterase